MPAWQVAVQATLPYLAYNIVTENSVKMEVKVNYSMGAISVLDTRPVICHRQKLGWPDPI